MSYLPSEGRREAPGIHIRIPVGSVDRVQEPLPYTVTSDVSLRKLNVSARKGFRILNANVEKEMDLIQDAASSTPKKDAS